MKVLIYGGAFDPPHLDHYHTAKKALEVMSTFGGFTPTTLWVLPTFHNSKDKEISASYNHRVHMLLPMVNSLVKNITIPNTHFMLSLYESANKHLHGTYNIVKNIIQDYPENEFSYVIGSDQALSIRNWKHSRALTKLLPFVIVERPGYELLKLEKQKDVWYKQHTLITSKPAFPGSDVSSTAIREGLANQRHFYQLVRNHNWLHKETLEYILSNGLYT